LTGTTSLTFFDDECVFNRTVIATNFIGDYSGYGNALTGLNADEITGGSITGTGAMVRASVFEWVMVGSSFRLVGFVSLPKTNRYLTLNQAPKAF